MQSVSVIIVVRCKNLKELGRVINIDMLQNVLVLLKIKYTV